VRARLFRLASALATALAFTLGLALSSGGCTGGLPAYAPCEDGRGCDDPAQACYELRLTRSDGSEATGRLCSQRCASDADCPEGGACLSLEGDPEGRLLCLARCEGPEGCYQGLRCTEVTGASATMAACLP
jgi:hypothetical protein